MTKLTNIEEAKGQIVRVKNKAEGQLGLFVCTTVKVGSGLAGTFMDDGEGAVVPFDSMEGVVSESEAIAEIRSFKAAKEKARIKEVVTSVENSQDEFAGTIVLHVSFLGSLAKKKAFTPAERKISLLFENVDPRKVSGSKLLFESKEYDELESFRTAMRGEFANLGIPFPLAPSMHLIRIVNIPKAEELATRTVVKMAELVERLKAVYPQQITPEAVSLGPLCNAGDYKNPEALDSLFKFSIKWAHFGTPDVLREIDMELWNRERARTAEVWRQAKEQGMMLLRKTLADMVARLVDYVTPNDDGSKKRFFGTAVTDLAAFFEAFEDRNMAGDGGLAKVVEQMKALVSNQDITAFRDDDALRQTVKQQGAEILDNLEALLVEGGERVFNFNE